MSDLPSPAEEVAKMDFSDLIENNEVPEKYKSLLAEDEPSVEAITKDTIPEEVSTESTNIQPVEEPQYSDIEKSALAEGWRPEGVVKDGKLIKKSAEEFVRDGEFISQLKKVREENQQLKSGMDFIIDKFKQKEQIAYERALKDIAKRKLEAVEQSDINSFQQAEQDMYNLQSEYAKKQHATEVVNVQAVVNEFETRNQSWYNDREENEPLVAYARDLDIKYSNSIPNHKERLAFVESKVKQAFSNHSAFGNVNRTQPSAVTVSTSKREVSKNSMTINDLPPAERAGFLAWKRREPSITVEDFLKEME